MMNRLKYLILTLCFIPVFISCEEKKDGDLITAFDFESIVKNLKDGRGGSIPLTVDRSVDIDGSMTSDGRWLFYASNRAEGSYDIYLRGMDGANTVRLTAHSARDTSPAISPDGRRLAFVSTRDNPEGDIHVVRVKPSSLIRAAERTLAQVSTLDSDVSNITKYQDPETGIIPMVRNASPAWSPDGRGIAFSSDRDGMENIWIMDRDGSDKRKITSGGGAYPAFSPDGKEIIFVSFREKGQGSDIHIINIETGEKRQITSGPEIDLYPAFAEEGNSIIFSRIDTDTSGDGRIDLNDASRIFYMNIEMDHLFPLTLHAVSSFNSRWVPAFTADYPDGIIVYSEFSGGNFNIRLMSGSGLIPLRENAIDQLALTIGYLEDEGDPERFFLGVERLYSSFHRKDDPESVAGVSRGLLYSWHKAGEMGRQDRAGLYIKRLQRFAQKQGGYSSVIYEYAVQLSAERSGEDVLQRALEKFKESEDEEKTVYVPYLLEDIADTAAARGDRETALTVYKDIMDEYPEYPGIYNVKENYSMTYLRHRRSIPDDAVSLLEDEDYARKDFFKRDILKYFNEIRDPGQRKNVIEKSRDEFDEYESIAPLTDLALAVYHIDSNRPERAGQILKYSLDRSDLQKDIIYYYACVRLGEIADLDNRRFDAQNYYHEAVNFYKRQWRDPRFASIITSLVEYYEEFGERAHYAGDHNEAVSLYENYASVMSVLAAFREYDDLYNRYAARAHILYINEYKLLHGEKRLQDLISRYERGQVRAGLNFDKAYVYALGYAYAVKALSLEDQTGGLYGTGVSGLIEFMEKSVSQVDTALFIDSRFIEPYILKSWIYQYMDLKRLEDNQRYDDAISRVFPKYLWEKNIVILETALEMNDSSTDPETEGGVHLNLANNYFLLMNYPRALYHYEQVEEYKNRFTSRLEEAQYYYHMSQCYWQEGNTEGAREKLQETLNIYEGLASGPGVERYAGQLLTLYRYFALMYRSESEYEEAVEWYYKILDFAANNRIPVDNARFVQEIAHCYMELGDYERALANIRRAQHILEQAPDDSQKFKVRLRFLERWTLFSFDLGPDSAVIGNNKIFTSLDRTNKRLLNLALLQDISERRNEYGDAIEYLKSKIEIHRSRGHEVDKEAVAVSLNNLGYYSFMIREYNEAVDKFKEAKRYARRNDNIDAAFTAIMNLSNLYAFAVENRVPELTDIPEEIKDLLEDIKTYRDKYKDEKFTAEYDKLKERADARGVQVKEDDVERIKKEIEQQAADIYFQVDIATGILEFYLAEFYREKRYPLSENFSDASDAFELYQAGGDLFELYNAASGRFATALASGNHALAGSMKVRLLLNSGVSKERTGVKEEAESFYSRASEIIDKYDNPGLFLHYCLTRGVSSASDGDMAKAASYFARGAAEVEKYPPLFSVYINRVRELYESYAAVLIEKGDFSSAFDVAERGRNAEAIMLFYVSGLSFSDEDEQRLYAEYALNIRRLDNSIRRISRLQDSGVSPEGERLASAGRDFEQNKKEYEKVLSDIKMHTPRIQRFVEISSAVKPGQTEAPVSMVAETSNGFSVITLKNRKFRHSRFDLLEEVEDYLKEEKRYLLMDGTITKLIKKGMRLSGETTLVQSVSSIPVFEANRRQLITSVYSSVRGVESYLEHTGLAITEGGRDADISGYSIVIDSAAVTLFQRFNILSRDSPGSLIELEDLFRERKARQTLIVKEINEVDREFMRIFLEGAAYSGVSAVHFLYNGRAADYGRAVSSYLGMDKSENHRTSRAAVFSAGSFYAGRYAYYDMTRAIEDEMQSYRKSLLAGDFREAGIQLNRWYDAAHYFVNREYEEAVVNLDEKESDELMEAEEDNDETIEDNGTPDFSYYEEKKQKELKDLEAEHLFELANLESLRGNHEQALEYAGQAAEIPERDESFLNKCESLKIFTLLQKGDIRAAGSRFTDIIDEENESEDEDEKELIDEADETNEKIKYSRSGDARIFKAVFTALEISPEESIAVYKEEPFSESENYYYYGRLRLLYENILHAAGAGDLVKNLPGYSLKDIPVSSRENLFAAMAGKEAPRKGFTVRKREIIRLNRGTDPDLLMREVNRLVFNGAEYDRLSVFPLMIAIKEYVSKNNFTTAINLLENITAGEIAESSNWMDALSLHLTVAELNHDSGRYADSLTASENALKLVDVRINRSAYLLKKIYLIRASSFMAEGENREAYRVLTAGERILLETDDVFKNKYTVMLSYIECISGRERAALSRIETAFETLPLSSDEEFTLEMIRAAIKADSASGKRSLPDQEEITEVYTAYSSAFEIYNESNLHEPGFPEAVNYSLDRYIILSLRMDDNPMALALSGIKRTLNTSHMIKDFYEKISLEPAEIPEMPSSDESAVLYFTAVDRDIVIFVVTNEKIRSLKIEDGSEKISSVMKTYYRMVPRLENTLPVSIELHSIFEELDLFIEGKRRLYITADSILEKIPFEIIGERELLGERFSIFYLSFIPEKITEDPGEPATLYLYGQHRDSIYKVLEKSALRVEGISSSSDGSMVHLHEEISYSPHTGEIKAGGRLLSEEIYGRKYLYLPAVEFSFLSKNDFVKYALSKGLKSVIINDAAVHDVNNAIFVEHFYRNISKGYTVADAYRKAKKTLKTRREYRHPAYWEGIRLYLN